MKTKFLLIPLTSLLVAGCSSPTPVSEPKYDEIELIRYENCLKLANQVFADDNIKQVWRDDLIASLNLQITKRCESFEPKKK